MFLLEVRGEKSLQEVQPECEKILLSMTLGAVQEELEKITLAGEKRGREIAV